ncbi:MAG: HpsJ family protein [Crinalium sp.]
MQTANSNQFAALALKLVGAIMILSSLLDYIVLLFPFNPTDKAWQLNTTAQLVDRGIIPLVGIALLIAGYWMSTRDNHPAPGQPWQDLRFWALLLSSFLGLIFLLLVPLHLSNINTQKELALTQISQGASQAEAQLQNQLQQVEALAKNEQRLKELDQAINSGQVQGEELARLTAIRDQLQTFKQDPKAINQQLETLKAQIRSRKLDAEKKANEQALKLGIRTGLSSLLLALGYIALGWTGLRSIGFSQGGRRKVKSR